MAGATVLVMAGQGITGPVLPLFAREFGVATSTVGLTITFFALARNGSGHSEEARLLIAQAIEMALRLDDPPLLAFSISNACIIAAQHT